MAFLIVVAVVVGFTLWPKSIANLGKNNQMATLGVYSQWQAGNVVVLVRHAERCDRSSNPCLGPADGITRVGNDSGIEAGVGFKNLGLSNTDILASPLHRTAQTATAIFGKAVPEQDWLVSCESGNMLTDIVAHKVDHRNLVLVTHSGCIGGLEKQLGYPHADTAEYTSSLFISLGTDKQPKILGLINVQDWPATLNKQP
ncbi:histidine phosphatase family protein [Pseudomonas sp. NA-150]|uniref:lipopolysaccharide core heptose(II)-phosphate phosphatase PmrG n=1 Tax=Pseudomonas sp. NA-150 TaxID=3367525 RepID=UPI0037CBF827